MKRKYTGLKKATAFALMLGLTAQFTACGGAEKVEESNEVVEVTVTPTPTPIEEVTNTPTPEKKEPAVPEQKDFTQEYMKFEEIEPTTLYANKDGLMLGNPNQFEGKVITQGSIEKGVAYEVTMKGSYEGVDYYGLVGGYNNIYIIKAEDLDKEAPVEPTPTTAPSKSNSSNNGGGSASSATDANVTYAPDTVGAAIESGEVQYMEDPGENLDDLSVLTDEEREWGNGFTLQ